MHRLMFAVVFGIDVCIVAVGATLLERSLWGGLAVIAVGLGFFALSEMARREHLREIDPGEIAIRGDALVVNHPALFKEPLVVPLATIRVAATEETQEAAEARVVEAAVDEVRFPIYGDEGGPLQERVRGYLWHDRFPVPIRRLGRQASRPNLIVLFGEPVMTPPLRRETWHGPKRSEALSGIALRVTDPALAQVLFRTYRVRTRIREQDTDVATAINTGELPAAGEDALTFAEGESKMLGNAAWGLAFFGSFLPPLSIWALPVACVLWIDGHRVHAVGLGVVTISMLGLVTTLAPPTEEPTRWIIGVALAVGLAVLVGWQRWRGSDADA